MLCDQTSARAPSAANQYRHQKLVGTERTKKAAGLDVIDEPSQYCTAADSVKPYAHRPLRIQRVTTILNQMRRGPFFAVLLALVVFGLARIPAATPT